MAEMLTAKDMQELLQVDRSTIYRMAEAGQIPAIKVGRLWRFPADRVKEWLQAQVNGSTPSLQLTLSPPTDDDLASLLPLECVQLIQDTFAEALGLMLITTDMQVRPITRLSNPCGLFSAINQHTNALQKCIEGWQGLAATVELEPKFTRSHLGLLCARAFVRVGSELKGMVIVGGIAPDRWPPSQEEIEAIAATFEVSPEVLIPHLEEVYHLEQDRRAWVLSLLQRIADIISHIATERSVLVGKLKTIAQLTNL